MVREEGHLGGYVEGGIGDDATYFPELWDWSIAELGIRSVLDIGCGEGHSLRYFREKGCFVVGLEGVPQDDSDILTHDFTEGPPIIRGVDLAWCCEFLEHIEERYLPNVVPAFQGVRYAFITHAFPGQPGYHHVNCRTSDYWMGFFAAIGFTYLPELTEKARGVAAANQSPWNHFVRSGLCFERTSDTHQGADE